MNIITLNWGHGPYSVSKIIRDIENGLACEQVEFLHIHEFGAELGDNYRRLSNWFEYRVYYFWAHWSGKQYGTGTIPFLKFRAIVKKYNPDIVHIHCPNAFSINLYKVLDYLKKQGIPTVITNHAEFFYTGNCYYAEECMQFLTGCQSCIEYKEKIHSKYFNRTRWSYDKMKESFKGFEKIHLVAVSPWVYNRLIMSPVCGGLPASVIYNGIDTDVFKIRSIRKRNEMVKTILHVTANFSNEDNDIKGGKYILELAKMCENESIKFVIVGNSSVSENQIPANVTLRGQIKDQIELAECYSMADLTLVTSKRETFGMTCAESLCCGTPVVGFCNGGTESIALTDFTAFVEFGDVSALKQTVLEQLDREPVDPAVICEAAHKMYSRDKMVASYLSVYRELLK